jgi:hypothetical protein
MRYDIQQYDCQHDITSSMNIILQSITSSMNIILQIQQKPYDKYNKISIHVTTKTSYSKSKPCTKSFSPTSPPSPFNRWSYTTCITSTCTFNCSVTYTFICCPTFTCTIYMNIANRLERGIYKQKEQGKYAIYLNVFPSVVAFFEDESLRL